MRAVVSRYKCLVQRVLDRTWMRFSTARHTRAEGISRAMIEANIPVGRGWPPLSHVGAAEAAADAWDDAPAPRSRRGSQRSGAWTSGRKEIEVRVECFWRAVEPVDGSTAWKKLAEQFRRRLRVRPALLPLLSPGLS